MQGRSSSRTQKRSTAESTTTLERPSPLNIEYVKLIVPSYDTISKLAVAPRLGHSTHGYGSTRRKPFLHLPLTLVRARYRHTYVSFLCSTRKRIQIERLVVQNQLGPNRSFAQAYAYSVCTRTFPTSTRAEEPAKDYLHSYPSPNSDPLNSLTHMFRFSHDISVSQIRHDQGVANHSQPPSRPRKSPNFTRSGPDYQTEQINIRTSSVFRILELRPGTIARRWRS